MRIRATELAPGDVLALHDWRLHVTDVQWDEIAAIRTAEFDFSIYFPCAAVVSIETPLHAAAQMASNDEG